MLSNMDCRDHDHRGRPQKTCKTKGRKTDKNKLLKIVEKFSKSVGTQPDSWLLNEEWKLVCCVTQPNLP